MKQTRLANVEKIKPADVEKIRAINAEKTKPVDTKGLIVVEMLSNAKKLVINCNQLLQILILIKIAYYFMTSYIFIISKNRQITTSIKNIQITSVLDHN